ncbi:MAG: hypothetical protein GX575_26465 [Candidatus Anammoximicrobium sp.]|nr:hypothetical protein [Candidatus Anammoximicrobium sp.]
MDEWPQAVLSALARTALVQMIASGAIAVLMRHRWQDQPGTCRLACFLVLLQGWMLVPLTVAVPWYDPAAGSAASAQMRRSAADDSLRDAWDGASLAAGRGGRRAGARAVVETADWAAAWRMRWSGWVGAAGPAAACLWLAGVLGIGAALVIRYRRFARTRRSLPIPCEAWLAEWKHLLRQHGVRREIPLLVTDDEGPLLCRLAGGPAVLVPVRLWQELPSTARGLILRHELAHYLRGDLWKSLLAWVLALPQWFHPGAWWALRMFEQCGERLCDELAAGSLSERVEYARVLARLAALRLPVHAVGSCAHSHPLVSRVQFLLASPPKENGMMRRVLLLAVAAGLFLAGAVRVELVAKDVTHTKESALAKIKELDQALENVAAQVKELKQKAISLKERVDAQISKAQDAYQSGEFSDEVNRRLEVLQAGEEAQQLAIVAEAKSRGEEGLVLLGVAAAHSSHQAVRRKALQAAFEVGVDAAPVFAYAFETLPDAERIFLAEQLARYSTPECLIGLGALVERAGLEVQAAAIRLAAASHQRVLALAVISQHVTDNPAAMVKLVEKAAQLQGEDGLLALYALAKYGAVDQKIAAVQAAVQRKQEGLPVLAAAAMSKEPEVRTVVVRAAKAIGGDLAEQGIQMALQDPDASLREAAEKAIQSGGAK